jgi:Domain of unknown function (DUF4340)
MFRKLNYKVLAILLALLLVLYMVSEYSGSDERTFKSEVVSIDTAMVTEIIVKSVKNGELTFQRTSKGWDLLANGNKYDVDKTQIENLKAQLLNMKSEGVAALDESKYKELEVDDQKGVHVIVKDGNKTLADLMIGKFNYLPPSAAAPQQSQQQQQFQQNQPRGKMLTYVKTADDEKVYAVEGYLQSAFSRGADDFRNKTIVQLKQNDVTQLNFEYAGSPAFTLHKVDEKWMIDNRPADSAWMVKYLRQLSVRRGNVFADDFNLEGQAAFAQLKIEGNNFVPVTIQAFKADSLMQSVLVSSQNPQAKFVGAKGVYDKIFEAQDEFTVK